MMAGSRTLTAAMLAAASAGSSAPMFFVEIDWSENFVSYLCTYDTISWGGHEWVGGGISVDSFDDTGKPSRIRLADPDAAYRTLQLGSGLRDRRIWVWKAYLGALAAGDPLLMFDGYADGSSWADGKLSFRLDWAANAAVETPRERIGPNIGVNFLATPDSRFSWGGQIIIIEGRK